MIKFALKLYPFSVICNKICVKTYIINDVLQLVMFTVPSLKVDSELEVELRFSTSNDNVTTISFKYLPRKIQRSHTQEISLFDNLLEFATNGDTISLLQPFVAQISKQDIEGNT